MEQEYKYMVCTSCMTYNHVPYIVDAMNGFAMQETTFPVYYLITDDASTDGEPEVIKQYLADHFQTPYRTDETDDYLLICAKHNTNPNCIFIVFFLKYNHYSIKKSKLPYQSEWRDNTKYIAICEGDDYWIHPKKLTIQYDALEADSNIGMCYTKSYEYNQEKGMVIDGKILADNKPVDFESFLLHEPTITLTAFYRRDILARYFNDLAFIDKSKWKMGDTPLWLWMSLNSKIIALEEITAVYRVLPESASHSKDAEKLLSFRKSYLDIRLFFIEKYGKGERLKKQVLDSYYREVMSIAYIFWQPKLYFSYMLKLNKKRMSDWINGGKLVIKYLLPRN